MLTIASKEYLDTLVSQRPGETKLGEKVQLAGPGNWEEALEKSSARFVLLGIPEDIGARANHGIGGAHTLWAPFLKTFLNIQHTRLLSGDDIIVLGAFDLAAEREASENKSIDELRAMVALIDEQVSVVIEKIAAAGKIPLVVGGGHNNAYPILKGISKTLKKPLNCINLDAHSDFRAMEGRHSGNGFRYAYSEGYLQKYGVIGLHENYNAQDIIDTLASDPNLHGSFYEDIFIRQEKDFHASVKEAIAHVAGQPTGIELDLDCIERVLASAMTPSGITPLQARQYISWCAAVQPAYLHITEGATQLADGRTDAQTAKLVAYLLSDFIKAYPK